MDNSLILYVILVVYCFCLLIANQIGLLRMQRERLKEIEDYNKTLDENRFLYKYCIESLLNSSIEKEDFETAARCKALLLKINEADKLTK